MIEDYFFRPVMQQCELSVRMGEVLYAIPVRNELRLFSREAIALKPPE